MKPITLLTASLLSVATLTLSGCIRPEAPNAEADILTAELKGVTALRPPVITNDKVTFYANPWEDLTSLTPVFTLTAGAKIEPDLAHPQDFSHPVTYTVTSEDGKWKKAYTVTVSSPDNVTRVLYSFEEIRLQANQYVVFPIKNEKGEVTDEWASANLGYALGASMGVGLPSGVDDYPVTQAANGFRGKALQLTTKSMKILADAFGSFMKVPLLATGSLYLGKLNNNLLMTEPLKATEFGIPLIRKPLMLTGYYRYTPGEKMIDDKGKEIAGRQDLFDIYAMVYEVTEETPHLDGTNNLTSPAIVMLARISDDNRKASKEWTRFEIPFTTVEGKSLDPDKLKAGKYNYSLVFSSSKDGGKFEGAAGSTLLIDEVELFFE